VNKVVDLQTVGSTTINGTVTLSASSTKLRLPTGNNQDNVTGTYTAGAGTFTDFTLDNDNVSSSSFTGILLADGVTIDPTATADVVASSDYTPALPTSFTHINNTGSSPISGHYANLPDLSPVTISGLPYLVDYEGGDGNDLTLTLLAPTTVYV